MRCATTNPRILLVVTRFRKKAVATIWFLVNALLVGRLTVTSFVTRLGGEERREQKSIELIELFKLSFVAEGDSMRTRAIISWLSLYISFVGQFTTTI